MAVAVASFGGIKGLIVCLNEQGKLSVTYLGTVPPAVASSNMTVGQKNEELDFEAMEKEHKQLLDDIRASQNRNNREGGGRESESEYLVMRAQLPQAPDILTQDQEIDLREDVSDNTMVGSGKRGFDVCGIGWVFDSCSCIYAPFFFGLLLALFFFLLLLPPPPSSSFSFSLPPFLFLPRVLLVLLSQQRLPHSSDCSNYVEFARPLLVHC